MFKNYFACLFFAFLIPSILFANGVEDLLRKKLKDAKIKRIETRDHFTDAFEIKLKQPLDHKNPSAGSFEQRIFLAHTNRKKPMVMVTEGYSTRFHSDELSKILQGNLLIVEYRYMGESAPEKMDWKYLDSYQASADLHRIYKLFKKIYKKKWVSTGISKGGTTAMIYKALYPKDICVVVPIVAPLALSQEDKRTDEHQKNVGTKACRDKIISFQRSALQRRENLTYMIDTFARNNHISFSLGSDAVLEYAVLEYPFSHWQWGASCDAIPEATASDFEVFDYLNAVVGFDFYSDATYEYFKPSFYQFLTELGYYGFPTESVDDLLLAVKKPNNVIFGPKKVDLTFKPEIGKRTHDYLMKKGNKFIYIYGEIDTWTACGITPSKNTNAIRLDKAGGSHRTRIKDFSKEEQQIIYDALKKWLKVKIVPLD